MAFRSFVDSYSGFQAPPGNPEQDVKTLPGEIVSSQCDDAYLYAQFGENYPGRVYCTNVRLCFVPSAEIKTTVPQRSRLFDDRFDVPLVAIHKIFYSVADTTNGHTIDLTTVERRKFKELTTSVSIMDIVSTLKIVLRDFRVIVFDLSRSQNVANLANHALHFSRPASAQHIPQCGKVVPMTGRVLYADAFDWSSELTRCGQARSGKWRVAGLMREGIAKSVHSYPMYVVVPTGLVKHDLDQMIPNWKKGRFPVWVWSHANGTSLIRSSYIEKNENAERLMNSFCTLVAQCSPRGDAPHSIMIPPNMGPARIAKAFDAVRRICAIDSYSQVELADQGWLSRVHDTHWPRLVSYCLSAAGETIDWMLIRERSIILYEEEGVDVSAIVSALVQVCLDPECRLDYNRLLLLVLKEFSGLGHPWCERTFSSELTCPTLLVFLDCVHQLMEIFPTQFAYTEHVLIALWDIAILGFLPSFTCNSVDEQSSFGAASGFDLSRLSEVWEHFFADDYIALFPNVWHEAARTLESLRPTAALIYNVIRPPRSIVDFRFWNTFFLRWVPPVNSKGGGALVLDRQLDDVMATFVRRENRAAVPWRRVVPPVDEPISSAHPYSPVETAHHTNLNRSIHEPSSGGGGAADTISLSGLSFGGLMGPKAMNMSADDSRSLRPKLSFKLPKRTKKVNMASSQTTYKEDEMLP